MAIVAYVSGHGLGHSTREIEILRRLPDDIPLIVKTTAPEWFWQAEMSRPFTYIPASFDVGCIQKNGLEMDIPATLTAWRDIHSQNTAHFAAEVTDLKACGARLVVTDVASFPLTVAMAAGIPSICISNFTWSEIYRAFVPEEPAFAAVAETIDAEYAHATLHLDAGFTLPMHCFHQTQEIGLVARTGQDRRVDLLKVLPPAAATKRLALVYVSGWGLPIAYDAVGKLTDWHFLSLQPPDIVPPNWSVISRDLLSHPELVASVDVAISKPGYGIAGECMAHGTPLLYPPRPGFAEYAPMHAVLSTWAGGATITLEDFLSGEWGDVLARIPERGTVPRILPVGGAQACSILTEWYRNPEKSTVY